MIVTILATGAVAAFAAVLAFALSAESERSIKIRRIHKTIDEFQGQLDEIDAMNERIAKSNALVLSASTGLSDRKHRGRFCDLACPKRRGL